jgi:hypothetical protein
MPTDAENARREIDSIMFDKNNLWHERWLKSDPAAIRYLNELWARTGATEKSGPGIDWSKYGGKL